MVMVSYERHIVVQIYFVDCVYCVASVYCVAGVYSRTNIRFIDST